jgi:hypothetical protein
VNPFFPGLPNFSKSGRPFVRIVPSRLDRRTECVALLLGPIFSRMISANLCAYFRALHHSRHGSYLPRANFGVGPTSGRCLAQVLYVLRRFCSAPHLLKRFFAVPESRMRLTHFFYRLRRMSATKIDFPKYPFMIFRYGKAVLEIFNHYFFHVLRHFFPKIYSTQLSFPFFRTRSLLSPPLTGRPLRVYVRALICGNNFCYTLGLFLCGQSKDPFAPLCDVDEGAGGNSPDEQNQVHFDQNGSLLRYILNQFNFRHPDALGQYLRNNEILLFFPALRRPFVLYPPDTLPHADIKRRLSVLAQKRIDIMLAWVYLAVRHLGVASAGLLRSPFAVDAAAGFATLTVEGA